MTSNEHLETLRNLCCELIGAVSVAKMAVDDYMTQPSGDWTGEMLGAQYKLAQAQLLAQEKLCLWYVEETEEL